VKTTTGFPKCGYCTPGQICFATAMPRRVQSRLARSNVSGSLTASPELTDAENIRCGCQVISVAAPAYPNIGRCVPPAKQREEQS